MALSILFRQGERGKIGEIELDATLSENHIYKNTITKFPIESGAVISDHIINEPVVLNMTGFVTNSPVKILGGSIGNIIRGGGESRVKLAFTTLIDIRNENIPFTVVTGLKTYRNMFFQNIDIPRDARTGDTLRFNAVMTKIPKVSAKTVEIQNLAQDETGVKAGTKDTAANNVNKGKQTTKNATDGQQQRTSYALKLGRKADASRQELLEAFTQLFGN